MTFGSTIKQARKAKNLTQAHVAKATRCDRVAVSNWENDKNLPDPKKIPTLAFLLNLNPTELMQMAYPGAPYEPKSWTPEDEPITVEYRAEGFTAPRIPPKEMAFKMAELYTYIRSMPRDEIEKTLRQLQVALKQAELRKAESELDDDQ
jgi:transcriptional regulator with XRE-family HTH domain